MPGKSPVRNRGGNGRCGVAPIHIAPRTEGVEAHTFEYGVGDGVGGTEVVEFAFYTCSYIIDLMTKEPQKLLAWLGSSKKDLLELPVAVRKFFGHALDYAQRGQQQHTEAGYGHYS